MTAVFAKGAEGLRTAAVHSSSLISRYSIYPDRQTGPPLQRRAGACLAAHPYFMGREVARRQTLDPRRNDHQHLRVGLVAIVVAQERADRWKRGQSRDAHNRARV